MNVDVNPLVVVVEDIEEDLRDRVNHFNDIGCTALGFRHSDEVVDALFVVPGVDLILTDIDLAGTGEDMSGIALAQFVRDTKLDVPVFGYSAYVSDQQLKDEDRSAFSGALLPKAMKAHEINELFIRLREVAVEHRLKRTHDVDEMLKSLRSKHQISISDIGLVRQLVLNIDAATRFDEALCEACYSLSIIHPREQRILSDPILVWLRSSGDVFEAEVYGFSMLYGSGPDETTAIDVLVELMQLVTEELLQDDDTQNYDANALRLRSFLIKIFGGVARH